MIIKATKPVIRNNTGDEDNPVFTTPILLPQAEPLPKVLGVKDTFASREEEDTACVVVPTFPFPNLAFPSTPQIKYSRVPLRVELQLQQQLNEVGGSATPILPPFQRGSDTGTHILPVRSFQPRRGSSVDVNHPNARLEETIDSSSEDLTLTPILPTDGWVVDLPPKRHVRHTKRSGVPRLQPRKAKVFDGLDDLGEACVGM